MDSNCVFCKIVGGDIPSPRFYEDDDFIVIKDLEPKAKLHYLCIPKAHYPLLSEMDEKEAERLKRIFKKIPEIAGKLGLAGGYRIVINQGDDAGQTVHHLHIHLLGGEKLSDF